jgi:hypothetical protein
VEIFFFDTILPVNHHQANVMVGCEIIFGMGTVAITVKESHYCAYWHGWLLCEVIKECAR